MRMRLLPLVLLLSAAAPATGSGQSVEMLFSPAVLQQALALKEALRVDKIESFSALALVGASAERRRGYVDKVSGATAVVVLGEDALRAVSAVEFSVPVILINASGPTAAKGRVIRVFDAASAPATARTVSSPADVAGLIGAAHDVALKGNIPAVVQALLSALK